MNQTTCILCGAIHYNFDEMCETCRQMMTGNVETANVPASSHSENIIHQPFNPAFESNQAAGIFQPDQSFQPPRQPAAYRSPPPITPMPPRYTPPPPPESAYKPSIWNWISDLPGFVKIGGGLLIFSICFAVVLKGALQMDVSVVRSDAKAVNLEPQKPWFSSWFRTNPTADEIFDKFESVSHIKGQSIGLQSLLISGKGEYVKMTGDPEGDLAAIRKGSAPPAEVPNPNKSQEVPKQKTQVTTQTGDFDVTFEISMKSPNKKLTKMTETPIDFRTSGGFYVFPTSGFDGLQGWKFTKTVINGVPEISNQVYTSNGLLMNRVNDGITLTFPRSMFSKIQFTGEGIVSNRKCYTIRTTDSAGESMNLFFDIETGLISRVSQNNTDLTILDYQKLDDTLLPSKIAYTTGKQWLVLTTEIMQKNVSFDDAIFRRTAYIELSKPNLSETRTK